MTAIGPYELIGKVAQTHHSTIWRAKDPHLNRDVALKQVNRQAGEQTLRREATLLATLDHPNIVHIYDILITDTHAWLIEEWINGATLAAVRDHSGKLTTHQALGITHGALQGLAYAHQRNIIHGDISPTNILITTTGTSQLIDFGSATHSTVSDSTETTETPNPPNSSGTNRYRSPEVANGQPPTKTSDVYSTAAVLTDLLTTGTTNTNPGTTDTQNPAPPTTLDPINHVLRKALNPNPNERHPDATALLADLQQATERALGPAWLTLASTSGLATATLTSTTALITNTTITGTATTTAIAGAATAPIAGTPLAAAPLAALGTPTTTEQLHATSDSSKGTGPSTEAADIQQVSSNQSTGSSSTSDSGSTGSATSTATQAVTRFPKKWLAIGGGAAATVAIVVTAAVVVNNSSTPAESVAAGSTATATENVSGPTGEDLTGTGTIQLSSPIPTPSSASANASSAVSASASQPVAGSGNPLAGEFSFVRTVTASAGNSNFPVGAIDTGTRTFTAACDDPTCAITEPHWGTATISGTQLKFNGTYTNDCDNGVTVDVRFSVTLDVSQTSRVGEIPKVIKMEGEEDLTVDDLNGCKADIRPVSQSYVLTRKD